MDTFRLLPAYSTAATPAKSAPNKPAWAATTPLIPFAPADDVDDDAELVAVDEPVEERLVVVRALEPVVAAALVAAVVPLPVEAAVVRGTVALAEDTAEEVLTAPVAVAE